MRVLYEIPRLDLRAVVPVTEPNNRVELRYHSTADRVERLTGGVPGWSWEEVEVAMADVDAVLVNFISGREMSLETAVALRRGFHGPMHGDLHSLFMGIAPDGTRTPEAIDDFGSWAACFDVLQMNEEEAALAGTGAVPPPGR